MRNGLLLLIVLGLLPMPVQSQGVMGGQNLLENGSFEHPQGPLHGWLVDYAWTRNRNYLDNASWISVIPQESGRRNVAQLRSPGDAGVKMESVLIPYQPGEQYRATLMVKGGPYRIYFSGYQWSPGIRPHTNPTHQEMRAAYRSKAEAGRASGWERVALDIPGVDATPLSLQHVRRVRFITLYMWFMEDGYVDDVTVVRTREADR